MCVGRAWEDHHLVEHSNVYVDEMVERCSFLWCNLSTSFRMPPPALRFTWEQLVWVAFMTLLEGFSKVPHCSTEGRSLMSMDLATLSHGLHPESVKTALLERHQSIITTPSDSCREDMMRYVDTFIKVFYFPDEVRVHLFFLWKLLVLFFAWVGIIISRVFFYLTRKYQWMIRSLGCNDMDQRKFQILPSRTQSFFDYSKKREWISRQGYLDQAKRFSEGNLSSKWFIVA